MSDPGADPRCGSILLPVIVVLLLIASAATAMTVQVRTTLREAATRRDRMALGFMADGLVRSAALALSQAVAARGTPPFALNGTPQACALPGGGRLVLGVQDEGGLVDLNKGARDLLLLLFQRAGLSGWTAKAITDEIVRRRDPTAAPSGPAGGRKTVAMPGRAGFASIDEVESLPGMTPEVFERLRPALSVANGSNGVDPVLASPGLKRLIPSKELAGPTLASANTPSSHAAFTITGTAVSQQGTRVQRQGTFQLDPNGTGPGHFTSWDAPVGFDSLEHIPTAAFCASIATALAVP